MADVIAFEPYLTWVDVLNPNEPPENAKLVEAADLLRYENLGIEAAALLNSHQDSLNALNTGLAGAGTRLDGLDTRTAAITTRLDNTATGLESKAPKASPAFTGNVTGITKAMVGLGSVDNTADASKPVSTLQKTYIDTVVEGVGSRVRAIETRASYAGTQAESQPINTSGPETLVMQLSPVTVVAGRSYKVTRSGNFHGVQVNMAGDLHVKSAPVGSSGIGPSDPIIVPSNTLWGSSSIPRGGNSATFLSTWRPTVSGTYRLYLSFSRTVGNNGVEMQLGSWNLYVEDITPMAAG